MPLCWTRELYDKDVSTTSTTHLSPIPVLEWIIGKRCRMINFCKTKSHSSLGHP